MQRVKSRHAESRTGLMRNNTQEYKLTPKSNRSNQAPLYHVEPSRVVLDVARENNMQWSELVPKLKKNE